MLISIPLRILISYIIASSISISLLVFINAQQPFVLSLLLGLSSRDSAVYSGTLVFADELLALPGVLVWGAIADRYGCRPVAVAGFAIAGIALVLLVHSPRVFPYMLIARLIFSTGGSALTTMLSAILTSLTWKSHIAHLSSYSSTSTRTPANDEQTQLINSQGMATYGSDVEETRSNVDHQHQSFNINQRDTTRLAGIIGFSTGIGALIAVFGYLRLPPLIAEHNSNNQIEAKKDKSIVSLQKALVDTFHIVAFVSVVVSIFLVWGLAEDYQEVENDEASLTDGDNVQEEYVSSSNQNTVGTAPSRSSFATRSVYEQTEERVLRRTLQNQDDSEGDGECFYGQKNRRHARPNPIWKSVWKSAKNLVKGFRILKYSAIVGIAYLGAFSARAQTVASSLFIPIMINKFFMDSGLCDIENPDLPSENIKEACHDAFVQTSILTGVLQLFALFTAPVVGYLATLRQNGRTSTTTNSGQKNDVSDKNFKSILIILMVASSIGAIGSLILSIFGPVNPLDRIATIPSAIAMGISQSSSIVLSLALCASARVKLGMSSAKRNKYRSDELSGAIAGAYSASGGLGIIFLSKVGSALIESYPGVPFVIIAILNAALVVSISVYLFCRANQKSIF